MDNKLKAERLDNKLRRTGIKIVSEYINGDCITKFECFCGKNFEAKPRKLLEKNIKSCGCLSKDNRNIIIGKKFGNLTVLKIVGSKNGEKTKGANKTIYQCQCDCGNIIESVGANFIYGQKRSCGCLVYQYRNGKNSYLWKGKGDISARFMHSIKGNAKIRGIEYVLTIDEIWELFLKQNKKCAITGEELSFGNKTKNQNQTTASLDRIDSKKGYIKDNIRWVHKIVNEMKFDLSSEIFFYYCYLIIDPIKENDQSGIEDGKEQNTNGWEGYKNISRTYWSQILTASKDREIPFNLSIEEAWNIFVRQNGHCAITGLPLQWGYKSKQTASLDRIDSKKTYEEGNIQWVHKDINSKIKKSLNENELKIWCQKIINFPNNREMVLKAIEMKNSYMDYKG